MKKNLAIISFAFIFLLSVSIVSAGITGYLVTRGGGISDAGTTATLQGVRDGVATIAVTTQAGDTQVVRVREGETATVGDAQISANSLMRGNLFRRGGANVKINVESAGASGVAKIATGGANVACTGTTPTTCDNVVDFHIGDMFSIIASNYGSISPNPSNSVLLQVLTGISPLSSGLYIYTQQVQFTRFTGSGTAYACLGPDGSLFRSDSPCK